MPPMEPVPAMEEPLVLVVGLGGVGSHCAHALVRAGVRRLRLVDFDRVSLSSLNRHAVATRRDVGIPKVLACAEHFHAIQPECQVDARDEMFTSAASDDLLGAGCDGDSPSAGSRPRVVIDCIDDVNTKADLLAACVARGLPALSALGSGAKSDATSLCACRGLQDVENDPLAAKLRKVFLARSVDVGEVTFVYSTQKVQRKLLPLSEEQRKAPEEFGSVANFRLRVIPVMGTQPAMEGIVLAVQALAALGRCPQHHPRPVAAPKRSLVERYLEDFRKREAKSGIGRGRRIDVTVAEATFLVQEIWHGRSAFTAPGAGVSTIQHLALALWDPERPADAGNIVLMTEQEAAAHTGPADVAAATRERVERALQRARESLGPPALGEDSQAAQLCPPCGASWPSRPARGPADRAGQAGKARSAREVAEEEALSGEQLSRSSAFFGPEGHASIRSAFVAIVGLGAVGSAAAVLLARAGVRRLRLVDGAAYVPGACHAVAHAVDAGFPKVDACRARFREIFPSCEVEAVAEHFELAKASNLFAPDADGRLPDLVLDCTTHLRCKVDLLRASADVGVRVVTVVAPTAADPTRIASAPLRDAYTSPAAVALRLAAQSQLPAACEQAADVVHTTEAGHWARSREPSIYGLAQLCLGMVAAAVALCRLSGEAFPEQQPPGMVGQCKKLRRALQLKHQQHGEDAVPDLLALGCLSEQVWRGRSAISGSSGDGSGNLCFARWDHSLPVGFGNLVLMTPEEADEHESAAARTGSLPQPLLEALAGGNGCSEPDGELLGRQLRTHRAVEALRRHLRDAFGGSSPSTPVQRAGSPPLALVVDEAPLAGLAACAPGVALCCALAAVGLRLGADGRASHPSGSRLAAAAAVAAGAAAVGVLIPALCKLQRSRPVPTRPRQAGRACADGPPRAGFAGLVGNTPLIELRSLSQATGCRILAKAEFLNPGGCQKDRAALHIIAAAESDGLLKPGGTIVEGTSGSTGISLSLAAAERGYRVHIVMPDDQAAEKVTLLRRFGAEVELVRPASITSPEHYVNVARRRAAELNAQPESRGAVFSDQFENLANFRAHYEGTGPEIWAQCGGQLDAFVMSAGTGGTISGVGRFLKEVAPDTRICLADVPGSSLYNKVAHGVLYATEQAEQSIRRHRTDTIAEGIGIDRLTANFARGLPEHNGGCSGIDDAVSVSDQEALDMAHYLLAHEGIFVGSSAAVNCVGAVKTARRLGQGRTVVTVLCDNGLRHLTKFYNPAAWPDFGLVPPQEHAKHDLSFVS